MEHTTPKPGQPVPALDAVEKVDRIAHRLLMATRLHGQWTPADQMIACEALIYLSKSMTALIKKTDPALTLPDVFEKDPRSAGGPMPVDRN